MNAYMYMYITSRKVHADIHVHVLDANYNIENNKKIIKYNKYM